MDGGSFAIHGNDDNVLVSRGERTVDLRGHSGGSWISAFDLVHDRLVAPMVLGGSIVWDLSDDGPEELGNGDSVGLIADIVPEEASGSLGLLSLHADDWALELASPPSGAITAGLSPLQTTNSLAWAYPGAYRFCRRRSCLERIPAAEKCPE